MKAHVPTAPTISSIIAGLQVQIAIRALHGLTIPTGKRIGLYGLSDVFFEIQLEPSTDCGLHSSVDPLPDQIESLETKDTLNAILQSANQRWNASSISWDFDRDLIVGLTCTSCANSPEFVGTQSLYNGAAECQCGGTFKQQIATSYHGDEAWGAKSLKELGFPAEHIYAADASTGRIYFRVAMA